MQRHDTIVGGIAGAAALVIALVGWDSSMAMAALWAVAGGALGLLVSLNLSHFGLWEETLTILAMAVILWLLYLGSQHLMPSKVEAVKDGFRWLIISINHALGLR